MKFHFPQDPVEDVPKDELKIIDGQFYEGQYVWVSINGNVVKRKVYYSTMAGDLFVRYKNMMYFLCEFNR